MWNPPEKGGEYAVSCGSGRVSLFVGQNRRNFTRLAGEFGVKIKTDVSGAFPEGAIRRI